MTNGQTENDGNALPVHRRVYQTALRAAKDTLKKRFRLVRLTREAYGKVLDEGDALSEVRGDLLALLRLTRAWAKGDYRRLSPRTVLSIVGALLYFISPIDAVPDFIPVVGLADDVAVIAAVVRSVRGDLERFRRWEAAQQRQQQDARSSAASRPAEAAPPAAAAGERKYLGGPLTDAQ